MEEEDFLERLFMFEFLVDDVHITTRSIPETFIHNLPYPPPLRVSISFLNFEPLEVRQRDFTQPESVISYPSKVVVKFNAGKSLVFPLSLKELHNNVRGDPLYVIVYRKFHSETYIVGTKNINMVKLWEQIEKELVCNNTEDPVSKKLEGSYILLTEEGENEVGKINLFLRVSFLGKSTFTLFRNFKDKNCFVYKKGGPSRMPPDPQSNGNSSSRKHKNGGKTVCVKGPVNNDANLELWSDWKQKGDGFFSVQYKTHDKFGYTRFSDRTVKNILRNLYCMFQVCNQGCMEWKSHSSVQVEIFKSLDDTKTQGCQADFSLIEEYMKLFFRFCASSINLLGAYSTKEASTDATKNEHTYNYALFDSKLTICPHKDQKETSKFSSSIEKFWQNLGAGDSQEHAWKTSPLIESLRRLSKLYENASNQMISSAIRSTNEGSIVHINQSYQSISIKEESQRIQDLKRNGSDSYVSNSMSESIRLPEGLNLDQNYNYHIRKLPRVPDSLKWLWSPCIQRDFDEKEWIPGYMRRNVYQVMVVGEDTDIDDEGEEEEEEEEEEPVFIEKEETLVRLKYHAGVYSVTMKTEIKRHVEGTEPLDDDDEPVRVRFYKTGDDEDSMADMSDFEIEFDANPAPMDKGKRWQPTGIVSDSTQYNEADTIRPVLYDLKDIQRLAEKERLSLKGKKVVKTFAEVAAGVQLEEFGFKAVKMRVPRSKRLALEAAAAEAAAAEAAEQQQQQQQ